MSPNAAAVAAETASQNASARRNARARKTSRLNIQLETDRADVDDELPRPCGIELPAQIADLDVDDVGLRHEFEVPHVLEEHRPGHDLARAAHEIFEELEFPRQEIDRSAGAANLALDQIHLDVARPQPRRARIAAASQERLDPRGQFANVEGLDEIVVAAGLQAVDPLVDRG